MKETDVLRRDQLEEMLAPFRQVFETPVPKRGWADSVRMALGMTKVQLAARLGRKAPQTIEDLLASEAAGTIKINSLREMAAALDCRLIYALVPDRPLNEVRRAQAFKIADSALNVAGHSMKLGDQGITAKQRQRALERLVDSFMAGNPRKLWE